jgi:hypothetical protein
MVKNGCRLDSIGQNRSWGVKGDRFWQAAANAFLALLTASAVAVAAGLPKTAGPSRHAMGPNPCVWWQGVNRPDGSTDIDATVRGLKLVHAHCGVYPIAGKGQSNSYDNLQRLLEATQGSGIELWTVLIPPSEGADSLPYRNDYLKWTRELAELSVRYKNFRGFNIDDIDQDESQKTFTHEYLCEIAHAKNEINPHFLFVPTVYDLDGATADRLAGCVDGVWLWWVNLEKVTGLRSFIENTRYVVHGRFPVYGGVYAHWNSWHKGSPAPDIFRDSLATTCLHADGVVIWNLPLDTNNPLNEIARAFESGGSVANDGRCGIGGSSGRGVAEK